MNERQYPSENDGISKHWCHLKWSLFELIKVLCNLSLALGWEDNACTNNNAEAYYCRKLSDDLINIKNRDGVEWEYWIHNLWSHVEELLVFAYMESFLEQKVTGWHVSDHTQQYQTQRSQLCLFNKNQDHHSKPGSPMHCNQQSLILFNLSWKSNHLIVGG